MQRKENQGFTGYGMTSPSGPVLVSIPHAGRDYPDTVFASLRLPAASLVRLEDRYADLLARGVLANEVPTIIAHRARAWIDLNREENDVDVEMISGLNRADYPTASAKQRGGLGLIPRRLSGEGDIWQRQLSIDDLQDRITSFHRPYHAAITQALLQMREKFGIAILLDLHSMPPISSATDPAPRFVIGDRFGRSASSRFAELLIDHIKARGFHVALNHPYAGDHMLRHHGNANHNIHALQLEVDRSLYLDTALREPAPGLQMVSGLIANLVDILGNEALASQTLMAAE